MNVRPIPRANMDNLYPGISEQNPDFRITSLGRRRYQLSQDVCGPAADLRLPLTRNCRTTEYLAVIVE
jgi:hypothetical protein